jgi:hypothetical protein
MQPASPNPSGFRPVRKLGTIVNLTIVTLAVVMTIPRMVSTWGDYARIQDLVAGRLTFDAAKSAELDSLMADAGTTAVTFLGVVAAGVVFLMWFSRARVNAELVSPMPHRLSRGWAIGGWFVPVANWWLPAVAMNDVARASDPDGAQRRVDPIVAAWWSSLVLSSLLVTFGMFAIPNPVVTYNAGNQTQIVDGAEEALSSYLSTALVNTASSTLVLVGAGLIAMLVGRISTQQTGVFERTSVS